MLLKSILLALDGSAEARYAAEIAWDIAKSSNCTVTALHVINSKALWKILLHHNVGFIGSGPYFAAHESIMENMRTLAKDLVHGYQSNVPDGVASKTVVSEGLIADEIEKHLEQSDILIIGHREHGDIHDEQPSVALTLLENPKIPIVVVQRQLGSWQSIRLVLGNTPIRSTFVPSFIEWSNPMKLRKEIYFVPDTDQATFTAVSNVLQEHARTGNGEVIAHQALSGADLSSFGVDEDDHCLVLIPVTQTAAGQRTALGKSAREVLTEFKGSNILFWPVESAGKPEGARDRGTVDQLV